MRILLAEYDALVASYLYRGLREHGHTVECVENPDSLFARAVEDELDTVLIDLAAPGPDGPAFVRPRGPATTMPRPASCADGPRPTRQVRARDRLRAG
jgi:two-component system OmpR family response regulator